VKRSVNISLALPSDIGGPYQCPKCGNLFTQKGVLRRHLEHVDCMEKKREKKMMQLLTALTLAKEKRLGLLD
jgi:uncharacterized C2H2 Zn-finger protein